jgi:hypothetical protein
MKSIFTGAGASMFRNLLLLLAFLGVTSSLALAADVDGKWIAEVPGRGGNTQIQTLTLKASGGKLTGSLESARGGVSDISDGAIDGNDVSFKVVREFNGNQFTQQYKGSLSSGGDLTLTVSGGGGRGGKGGNGGKGGGRELVFKRAG